MPSSIRGKLLCHKIYLRLCIAVPKWLKINYDFKIYNYRAKVLFLKSQTPLLEVKYITFWSVKYITLISISQTHNEIRFFTQAWFCGSAKSDTIAQLSNLSHQIWFYAINVLFKKRYQFPRWLFIRENSQIGSILFTLLQN